ncbi:pseudouridine synthase [Bartonella ancashensis]|uniref:pseudouridine synthase n=1 Tax=Bartonella ancashensis TaxID=1318743 RepID=UPI0006B4BD2D|nr:pseudouridine synthase [Bartonella ancashensis]
MCENCESERIAKRLARAGIASRRDAEMMIIAGRVMVNGAIIKTPALNVAHSDVIMVDGAPLPPVERTRLWLYHKPAGLVTTNRDPENRPTVFDCLPEGMPRVLSIGRLDINTEGLLLLTNDGGLARVLELPLTGWVRKYRVRAYGKVKQKDLDNLKNGIAIDGIFYGSIEASIDREQGSNIWLSVALREGKNREIKNILGALGLSVNRLIRVSYGPFQLSDLQEGAVRELRGRILRDQLGERLIMQANANFDAPILKPFSNSAVVSEQENDKQSFRGNGGWIFSDNGKARQGTRSRSVERDRARLGTKLDDRSGSKEERFLSRSRRSNVWMASGARPQVERKKFHSHGDDERGYSDSFSSKKRFHKDGARQLKQSEKSDSFNKERDRILPREMNSLNKEVKHLKKKLVGIKNEYDENSLVGRRKAKISPYDRIKKFKPSDNNSKKSKLSGESRAGRWR